MAILKKSHELNLHVFGLWENEKNEHNLHVHKKEHAKLKQKIRESDTTTHNWGASNNFFHTIKQVSNKLFWNYGHSKSVTVCIEN